MSQSTMFQSCGEIVLGRVYKHGTNSQKRLQTNQSYFLRIKRRTLYASHNNINITNGTFPLFVLQLNEKISMVNEAFILGGC